MRTLLVAFWLRQIAAAHLHVDPTELRASMRMLGKDGLVNGEEFLCDSLENGAGYSMHLAQPEVFAEVLRHVDYAWAESAAATLLRPDQGDLCDTSCNHCLRDYQTLAFHGLLDWRLALDMARLLSDGSATVDLDSPWGDQSVPRSEAPGRSVVRRAALGDPQGWRALRGKFIPLRETSSPKQSPFGECRSGYTPRDTRAMRETGDS